MSIEIDLAAIEKQIQSDSVMLSLQKKRERWLFRQEAKRKLCFEKIAAAKKELKVLQHNVTVARAKSRAKAGLIQRLHGWSHYKYGGLRRIDAQISLRRKRVKAAAVAKATALAQREALKRYGLGH